jgi:hypothetical protein
MASSSKIWAGVAAQDPPGWCHQPHGGHAEARRLSDLAAVDDDRPARTACVQRGPSPVQRRFQVICTGRHLTNWQSCSADDRTVLSNLAMDQAALRTLVSLLWDGGCELRVLEGGDPASRRP